MPAESDLPARGVEAPASPPRRTAGVRVVYALAVAWILGKAALFRTTVPASVPPDERAHVSYVAYVEASGRLLPRYEEMHLLDEGGLFGPLPSYLPHPSLYYALLGRADQLAGDGGRPPPLAALTARLRRLSAPLFAIAAALFLWVGARRTASVAEHAVYAAAVATVPSLSFVGAAVNNDVLAFLAGGIAVLGLARWLEGRADDVTATLVGGGLALALLSKLTAGLLVASAVLAAGVATRGSPRTRASARLAVVAVPWLLLPAIHFGVVLFRYGTPIPGLDVVHPAAFVALPYVLGPPGDAMTLLRWGARIAEIGSRTWFSLVGHVWLPVGPPFTLAGPAGLLALAAAGLAAPTKDGPDDVRVARTLGRIGAAAFAATLLVNLAWSYDGYAEAGRVGGIHARYYLPLLPCLALAATVGFRRLGARPWLGALLAGLLVLADASVTARFLALLPR